MTPSVDPPQDRRTVFQRIRDSVALATQGGARIRVYADGGGIVLGEPPEGWTAARLLQEALALKPTGAGTIDVTPGIHGAWTVETAGPLASPRLEQRLRNVLGNL